MLADFLTCDCIRLNVACDNWKEAVKAGTDLLLEKKCIEPSYLAAIIHHHENFGPYMVVAPGIVLAHARPEDGAKKVSISLVTLKKPIVFGNVTNDPVKLVFTFATTDNKGHLSLLADLMELLSNEEDMQVIMSATQVNSVIDIIKQYSN
ncbi:MAG: putative IIA-like nitrogen-regulatory protein PtsN [Massilibacillus sp.]|jgi:PTS system ascorbate-specific IIA component|nr:putative IIA-like nitrogen-regulatory protein PtsN [Massilibacillus sp.]